MRQASCGKCTPLSRLAVSRRHQRTAAEPNTYEASPWCKAHPTTVVKQQGTEPGLLALHAITGANNKLILTTHICQRTVQSIGRQYGTSSQLCLMWLCQPEADLSILSTATVLLPYSSNIYCCHSVAPGVGAQHLFPCSAQCLRSAALGAAPARSTDAAAAPPLAAAPAAA